MHEPGQTLRRPAAGRSRARAGLESGAWRMFRAAGSQRRRQDHHDRNPRRTARAHLRRRRSLGIALGPSRQRNSPADRHLAARDAAVGKTDRAGNADAVSQLLSPGLRRRWRCSARVSLEEKANCPGRQALGRAKAAAGRGLRAGGRSGAVVSRRADHRARSAIAAAAVGDHSRNSRRPAARCC